MGRGQTGQLRVTVPRCPTSPREQRGRHARATPCDMRASDWVFDLLVAATALIFGYLIIVIFYMLPTAQLSAGGIAQRIFYFHFPSIFCGFFLSIFVCFAASAGYLVMTSELTNALARAGADCAVAFGAVMLTS